MAVSDRSGFFKPERITTEPLLRKLRQHPFLNCDNNLIIIIYTAQQVLSTLVRVLPVKHGSRDSCQAGKRHNNIADQG
jgi:hypothetical protein